MKKRIIPVVLILILIAGSLYYYLTHNEKEPEQVIKVSGNIETTEANVGFKIAGRVVSRSSKREIGSRKGMSWPSWMMRTSDAAWNWTGPPSCPPKPV